MRWRGAAVMVAAAVAGVLPATLAVPPAAAGQTAGGSATAAQLDASHTGHSPDGVAPPLTAAWSRDLTKQVHRPIVADGRVFVTAADADDTYGSTLYAFDGRTGATLWGPVALEGTYYNAWLTYGGGRLFSLNTSGEVRAFDPRTGRQLWHRTPRSLNLYHATAAPTYANGMLYVIGVGSRNTLLALSAVNGQVVWATFSSATGSSPVVTDEGLYLGNRCTKAEKWDPYTGVSIWKYDGGDCVGAGGVMPVLGAGRLWIRDPEGTPYILDPATGLKLGEFDSVMPPAFDVVRGYFTEYGKVVARDPTFLTEHWTWQTPPGTYVEVPPIVVNGTVYAGISDGKLFALDAATGAATLVVDHARRWETWFEATGLAAGQGLLVVPVGWMLYAYRSASGPGPAAPSPLGSVRAWGWNAQGQLGDGTTVSRIQPVAVSVPGPTDLAAGQFHTVARREDGTVAAWGWNGVGQLGDGTTTDRASPVAVGGLAGVVKVVSGGFHNLALKSDGTVWAWGWNVLGQLGDGTTIDRRAPVRVAGLDGVIDIAAGNLHSLAVRDDGTVWSWGWNVLGQLGDGTTVTRYRPVLVQALAPYLGVVSVAAGAYHSLASSSDTLWAWGWNGAGQLGDGTLVDRHLPVAVPNFSGAAQVAGGAFHTVALKGDGTVWTWGLNVFGQLGDGTTQNRARPAPVAGLRSVQQVAGGGQHTVAVRDDGTVWTWGWNGLGQLGGGGGAGSAVPLQSGVVGARAVAAGSYHTVVQ